jgi:hypothetical protein
MARARSLHGWLLAVLASVLVCASCDDYSGYHLPASASGGAAGGYVGGRGGTAGIDGSTGDAIVDGTLDGDSSPGSDAWDSEAGEGGPSIDGSGDADGSSSVDGSADADSSDGAADDG